MWFDLTPIQHDLTEEFEYPPKRKSVPPPKPKYDPNWREPTICPWCKKELIRRSYTQKYHAACATEKDRARLKGRDRLRPQVKCANPACDKMFAPRNPKHTECSQDCRAALGKKRNH